MMPTNTITLTLTSFQLDSTLTLISYQLEPTHRYVMPAFAIMSTLKVGRCRLIPG